MGKAKQINIKNQTYYFYNDIVNIKNFDPNLLKIDKKSYKNIGIHNIGYIAIKKVDGCENIYSVTLLYLLINHSNGYIEKECANKYLVFDSTDENEELLKKHNDIWSRIKNKIEEVSGGKYDCKKDDMKIEFNSDEDLPLSKPLKFQNMTITINSVFEDSKLYLQVYLDDT